MLRARIVGKAYKAAQHTFGSPEVIAEATANGQAGWQGSLCTSRHWPGLGNGSQAFDIKPGVDHGGTARPVAQHVADLVE